MMKLVLTLSALAMTAVTLGQPVEKKEWAVPDVRYTCVARVAQDWNSRHRANVIAETAPFVVGLRSISVDLRAKDFIRYTENSRLKSLSESDLRDFALAVSVHANGLPGISLESTFSVRPETLDKFVHVVAESSGEGTPRNLETGHRILVGDRHDIVKSGPLHALVRCRLNP